MDVMPSTETESLGQVSVSLQGWFHIVWNAAPRYVLIDDRGRWRTLLLTEDLLQNYRGGLILNRKRVAITGELTGDAAGTVRVTSIRLQ